MRWVSRWGGLLLGVVLIAAFVWMFRQHLPEAGAQMLRASIPLLLVAVALQLLHLLLRALRWRLLLAPIKRDTGIGNLFSTTVIGYFASTIIPFRVGELVRPLLLASREGISRTATLATIGVERILDTLTVGLFLATYLIFWAEDLEGAARASGAWQGLLAWARLAGVLMLLGVPVLFLTARYGAAWIARAERRARGARQGRALALARGIVSGMGALAQPRRALVALGASILVWLAIAAGTWAGVSAMRTGIAFPFQATLLLVPLLAVGVSAPSPGGAGGYHIICALALEQFFGASGTAALATAVVLWFLSNIPVVALGFFFLWRAGLPVREMVRIAGAAGPPDAASSAAGGADGGGAGGGGMR
jgi:glycosyltransferase 2 family protein